MNVIVAMLDSFRQDHVGAYHGGKEGTMSPPSVPSLDPPSDSEVLGTRGEVSGSEGRDEGP